MPLTNDELRTKLRNALSAVDDAQKPTQKAAEIGDLREALTAAIQFLERNPGGRKPITD